MPIHQKERLHPAAEGREKRSKSACLTYIIEKGEHSQAVGLISGFNKALVLVRIVMDDVELKEKQTQWPKCGARSQTPCSFKSSA